MITQVNQSQMNETDALRALVRYNSMRPTSTLKLPRSQRTKILEAGAVLAEQCKLYQHPEAAEVNRDE